MHAPPLGLARFAALGLCSVPTVALADNYTVDYTQSIPFAITAAWPSGDTERHYQQFFGFTDLDEHYYADSFSGTGIATAEAMVSCSMTPTTISISGSIANFVFMGDATSLSSQTESAVEVVFTVNQPTAFQFSGSSALSIDQPLPNQTAQAFLNWPHGNAGVLAPGQYTLQIGAKVLWNLVPQHNIAAATATGEYACELELTPIPAPGGLSVLLPAWCFASRRRRAG